MRKLFLFLTALLLSAAALSAQTTTVTGTVLSAEDDEPIIGASVRVKGHKTGAITDADGYFKLSGVTARDKELEVSFVGCETQYIPVAPNITVRLRAKSETMDEVIVVAFGKQKRESFTGSAAVVSSATLERQQVNSPIEAINGRVTGVQMTDANGPTSDPGILVRGISSLNASTAPLIVLDGMPYNGYWNDLNPADIENITVLKDAASCALYGARGANGVILITSKQAQRGNTRVNLDARWGVNTDGRVRYNIIENPGEYYEAAYLGYKNYFLNNQGLSPADAHISANEMMLKPYTEGGMGYIVYSVPENQYLIGTNGRLNPYATLGNRVQYNGQFYTLYPDNWFKAGTRDALRQEYNLNLSGGNDQFRFLASLGYLDEDGIAYGTDLKRYTARIKAEYQAFPWLRVGANAAYNHQVSNVMGNVFAVDYNIAPIFPLYLRDGNGDFIRDQFGARYDYGNGDNAGIIRPCEQNGNPIQDDMLNVSNNVSHAFNISGFATIDFLKHFSLTVNGNVYITNNRMKDATNPYYGYANEYGGYVWTGMYKTADSNFQQLLNYNQSFGRHNVSALLGHEYSRTEQNNVQADKNRVAMYMSNTELAGAIINSTSNGYVTLYNVEGYFLRAQYDYDNRYFVSGSYRRDGSSRFAPGHRWGNFWSLGAAWIATREEWFPKTSWLNLLKVKASYGEQGNDGIGNNRYTDYYTINNSNDQVSYVFNSKGNRNITWETVGSFNAGVEFEMFNARLRGGLEFYTRSTRDMLMFFSTPYIIGYSGYYSNVGDMNNRGIEFDVTGDIIANRDLQWSVDLNLTWQRNRVTRLPESSRENNIEGYPGFVSSVNYIGEGLPVNTWYLKQYAGVAEDGQATYWKTNADGTRTATTSYSEADYYLCGNALPDVFGGFGTSLKYRGFDLNATFNYSIGGLKMDYGYQSLMTPSTGSLGIGHGWHKDIFKSWSPYNTSSDIPRWQYDDNYTASLSDRWLCNASFLTFRNLTVGYTLPASITRRFYVNRLRIYFSGENLYYWTKRKGFDPRSSFTEGSYGGYAPTRNFTGGIQIQL